MENNELGQKKLSFNERGEDIIFCALVFKLECLIGDYLERPEENEQEFAEALRQVHDEGGGPISTYYIDFENILLVLDQYFARSTYGIYPSLTVGVRDLVEVLIKARPYFGEEGRFGQAYPPNVVKFLETANAEIQRQIETPEHQPRENTLSFEKGADGKYHGWVIDKDGNRTPLKEKIKETRETKDK